MRFFRFFGGIGLNRVRQATASRHQETPESLKFASSDFLTELNGAAATGNLHHLKHIIQKQNDEGHVIPATYILCATSFSAECDRLEATRYLCEEYFSLYSSQQPVDRAEQAMVAACAATRNYDCEVLEYVCGLSAFSLRYDVNDDTVLQCAAAHGNARAVKMLCQLPTTKITFSQIDYRDSFICAAKKGYLEIVKFLAGLPTVDPMYHDEAIIVATCRGYYTTEHVDVVKFLYEYYQQKNKAVPDCVKCYLRNIFGEDYHGIIMNAREQNYHHRDAAPSFFI